VAFKTLEYEKCKDVFGIMGEREIRKELPVVM